MFCPKCATQNVDGASYCRACGANISLVPQALTGELPVAESVCDFRTLRHRRREELSTETAIRSLMMGITFAIVAILVAKFAPSGGWWWFWLLIPAMGMFSKGFAALARRRIDNRDRRNFAQPQVNSVRPNELFVPGADELSTPIPSVTENTTRHLGAVAETRHLDSQKSSAT
jgi:hypothetical protein